MNESDLDEYFPRATREQRIAIPIYHDTGWTVEMSYTSDCVEISRDAGEWLDRAVIHPNGHLSSR